MSWAYEYVYVYAGLTRKRRLPFEDWEGRGMSVPVEPLFVCVYVSVLCVSLRVKWMVLDDG